MTGSEGSAAWCSSGKSARSSPAPTFSDRRAHRSRPGADADPARAYVQPLALRAHRGGDRRICLGGATERRSPAIRASPASRTPRSGCRVLLGIFPGFGGTQRLPRSSARRRARPDPHGRALDARRRRPGSSPAVGVADRAPTAHRDWPRRGGPDGTSTARAGSAPVRGPPVRASARLGKAGRCPRPHRRALSGAARRHRGAERTLRLPIEAGLAIEASRVADLVVGLVCRTRAHSARRSAPERPVADPLKPAIAHAAARGRGGDGAASPSWRAAPHRGAGAT